MNLGGRLNEVLQMRSREEITQVHKLAVVSVLNIHNAPTVFATAD